MATPAGFWRRYAAWSLDALAPLALSIPLLWSTGQRLLAQTDLHLSKLQLRLFELADAALDHGSDPLQALPGWTHDPTLRAGVADLAAAWGDATLVAVAVLFALSAAWWIAFEASPWQATPGKRLFGLQVTRHDGGQPGPGRVALRFLAGIPSWCLLHLGHAMAGWRADQRALHDLLSGTRVVLAPGEVAAMPPGARRWLWAQAIALLVAFAAVATAYALMLAEALATGLP
ncbi:MAG: RDD family protein [Rhizobium sp.]|nr:RDD family protein [Rhizobium sp.]